MSAHKPYHHGNLRSDLIRASLELIREQGPQGFSLREVSRRAGVSHSAAYRHFKDRDAILAAVAEEGFLRLTRALQHASLGEVQPLEHLSDLGVTYVEFALDQPEHFRVMFSLDLSLESSRTVREAAGAALRELESAAGACQKGGLLRRFDTGITVQMAWAMVHGVADLIARGQLIFGTREEIRAFARQATQAVQFGLADDSPR